jgi:hypothetical protein
VGTLFACARPRLDGKASGDRIGASGQRERTLSG